VERNLFPELSAEEGERNGPEARLGVGGCALLGLQILGLGAIGAGACFAAGFLAEIVSWLLL
jgi:hypothetical protein